MKIKQPLHVLLVTIFVIMMIPGRSYAWSLPWRWNKTQNNTDKKTSLVSPQTSDPVVSSYVKGTRTDMAPHVSVPPIAPPSGYGTERDEPWQMRFLTDSDKKDISSAIADNIARRIDLYAGSGVRKPDLTIYHYENLSPELQKVQDKALNNKYGKPWKDLPQESRSDFDIMLEEKGEYAENRIVGRIASNAKEIFRLELELEKPDLETWSRTQLTEKVTIGLATVDPQTGQIVNRYGSVYEAYGGFLIDNTASLMGLEGLGPKIVTDVVSKTYDKAVIPESEKKKEAERLYKAFEEAEKEAGRQVREVDISGYRSVRRVTVNHSVLSSRGGVDIGVTEDSPYLTNTVRNITNVVKPGYIAKALTGNGDTSLAGISANTSALQRLIAFTAQTQAWQIRGAYQTGSTAAVAPLQSFARNPALDAMGHSLVSDELKAKTYLENGDIDSYNAMVPIVNQKARQYWGAMQNDRSYLSASQAQCRRITGSDLPSEAPQLPYANK